MKKANFYFKFVPARAMAEVYTMKDEEKAKWLDRLLIDLILDDEESAVTALGRDMIAEANEYRRQQSEYASKRWGNSQGIKDPKAAIKGPIAKGPSNSNSNSNNNINNESKEMDAPAVASRNSKLSNRFLPPTIEQVAAHIVESKSHIDPAAFHAFYESNGWMIGKNKMKSWQHAIITWEKKTKVPEPPPPPQVTGPRNTLPEHLMIEPSSEPRPALPNWRSYITPKE